MTSASPTETATEDRLAILELTERLALQVDARDWDPLEGCSPTRSAATAPRCSAASLRRKLTPSSPPACARCWGNLDATHHLITCQSISLDGDEATSAANMQGKHVLTNGSSGPMWTVARRHDYKFTRTADGRRIAAITFTVQWASGNQYIVALAAGG
jgi:hypothetical protein